MKILLTCGIGDFIALEGFITFKEAQSVETIYWATRAREAIMLLVPFVFPNVKEHIVVKDTWGEPYRNGFCFESIEDIDDMPEDVVDFSIKPMIESIKRGNRRYNSSFLDKKSVASIADLNLPEKYFVVHPYSENARSETRDMTAQEWTTAWRSLCPSGIPIVIINKGSEKLKQYPNVIDLTDKLDLLQAIEVVRASSGFIGSSSVFSVIAAKFLAPAQLFIKGHTLLKNEYSWFYYAPHEDPQQLVTQNLLKVLPRLERFGRQRHIIVNTVQGIGDIFWVYQKLSPYFDKISLNILCTRFDIVQQRSKSFAKLLPKVDSVSFTKVSSEAYDEVAKSNCKLDEVLSAYDSFINGEICTAKHRELGSLLIGNEHATINYAVNSPLERGIHLDKIDPDKLIEESVKLVGIPLHVKTEDYLCVFVAGAKNDKLWTPKTWVKMIDGLMPKLGLTRIVLVGAEWDVPVQSEIYEMLKDRYEVLNYVNEFDLPDTIDVIRRSRFFLAYQSGLSIIADNYDVPQLMIYFEHLAPMKYTWCKPANDTNKIFQAATFDESVDYILSYVHT